LGQKGCKHFIIIIISVGHLLLLTFSLYYIVGTDGQHYFYSGSNSFFFIIILLLLFWLGQNGYSILYFFIHSCCGNLIIYLVHLLFKSAYYTATRLPETVLPFCITYLFNCIHTHTHTHTHIHTQIHNIIIQHSLHSRQ